MFEPSFLIGPEKADAGGSQNLDGLPAVGRDRAGGPQVEEMEFGANRAGGLPNLEQFPHRVIAKRAADLNAEALGGVMDIDSARWRWVPGHCPSSLDGVWERTIHFVVSVEFFDSAGTGSRCVALTFASLVGEQNRKALPPRG